MIFACLFRHGSRLFSGTRGKINKQKTEGPAEPDYTAFTTAKVVKWAVEYPDNFMRCSARISTQLS